MTIEPQNKERLFELLRDDLIRFYERFLETGFKTGGILLIILGWLVGTESASKFFKGESVLIYGGISLLLAGGLIYVITLTMLRGKSATTFDELKDLAVFEEKFFSEHEIPGYLYWCVVGLNEALFLFTIIALISVGVP